MAVKKPVIKQAVKKTAVSIPQNKINVIRETEAIKNIIKVKKNNTVPVEKIVESHQGFAKGVEETITPNENNEIKPEETVISNGPVIETTEKTEPIIETGGLSINDDLAGVTQEDLDKTKDTIEGAQTATEQRLNDITDTEIDSNAGATDEEDTPEYRKQMSLIKAKAMVEFFDVVFMIICLILSKNYSDDAQRRFSLVKERKNAIAVNITAILVASKKKHRPMGTVVFLIIFSYVPLIVVAIMERIKLKKEKQENEELYQARLRETREAELLRIQNENHTHTPIRTTVSRKPSNKIVQAVKTKDGKIAQVKENKDGSFTNIDTGEVYKGGRGRKPNWMVKYFGKIG